MAVTYRGPALPFSKSTGGSFKSKGLVDLIWSNVLVILLSQKGTRPMFYSFGTNLSQSLFDRVRPEDADALGADVKRQIEQYEPRVTVNNVVSAFTDQYTLVLRISLTIIAESITTDRSFEFSPNGSVQAR